MKKLASTYLLLTVITAILLWSCEKEITVDLPTAEPKIVVEGSIEQGQPPLVILSRSQGYFDPVNLNEIQNIFVSGAEVRVSNGSQEVLLDEICTNNLDPDLLPLIAELAGLSPEQLVALNLCIYTSFDQSIWGEANTSYDLEVRVDNEVLTSRTKINTPIALDSIWFSIPGSPSPSDSLGFIYAVLTDPDTLGNAYRWFAQRINQYPEWSSLAGEQKDQRFIAPLGSATDDVFFNGASFEFAYFRGNIPNSTKEDDLNDERAFFKRGDTVVVRATVIDRGALAFISSFEDQVASGGSVFASPANIQTNVNGGLGAWIGYGAVYDTVICTWP